MSALTPNKKRRTWRSVKRYVETELANISNVPIETSQWNHDADSDSDHETVITHQSSKECDRHSSANSAEILQFSQEIETQYSEDLQFDTQILSDITSLSGQHENTNRCNLKSFLGKWAVDNHVSISSLSSLLKGLKRECCSSCTASLPADGRSLLKTDRDVSLKIQNKAGGQYIHIGVEKCIQAYITSTIDDSDTLKSIANIDGLPIFKSSGLSFWPILLRIVNGNYTKPFVVGLFSGTSKPQNVNEYLSEFVSEMVTVIANGIKVGDIVFKFSLKCIVTDAPAMAMIKGIKAHCGFYGCPKCIQEGSRASNCTVFLETDAEPRTDDSFRRHLYEGDHQNAISPLLALPIDMVNDVPFDYMHVVCLGVVKRLLNTWLSGPLPSRLPSRIVEQISSRLVSLRGHLPCEFARQPRTLGELGRWKATELRQFLLYSGILVLDGILNEINSKMYPNFLLLHAGIQILCRPSILSPSTIQFAHECLVNFIQTAKDLYGEQMIVYNVHCLSHLSADVARMGSLDSYSCFPFENYMSTLKRFVRSPNNPLAQVVSRLQEKLQFIGKEELSEKKKNRKKGFMVRNGLVTTSSPDNCVRLANGGIFIVVERKVHDGLSSLMCKKFRRCESFFSYPCSSLNLGIAAVSDLMEELQVVNETDVVEKLVILPKSNTTTCVVMPLFHSEN